MPETTTVTIHRETKESLDDAAEQLFNTEEVPYHTVVDELVSNVLDE